MVGTGAGRGGDPAQTEATLWVNGSMDCPKAPAQAHHSSPDRMTDWERRVLREADEDQAIDLTKPLPHDDCDCRYDFEPDPLTDTVTPPPLDESPMFHQVVASEGETP